jgi:ABC-2 type transport system ATP-binding protein/lipopolysaccharide transport system ATP-binding protein
MAEIRLEHVSVSFPIFTASGRSLKKQFVALSTGGRIATDARQHVMIQALDDVCLTVAHGDRIGLVGHNGAGKTTLLRVMAGIYEPVAGRVVIKGRAVPFFDIGLGMDVESTGYENIRLRGLYLGLSRAQIKAKVDEIAEFTELGTFLDMPLRTYSAGMHARLAFAISTCVHPEILLLDEGLGAGDAAFLERAERRLADFVASAGILVLASHTEQLIRRMCTTAVLLEHGRVVTTGSPDAVFARYRQGP